jgi:beta-lactamase regulating signal transducer with metallopeptidase domain
MEMSTYLIINLLITLLSGLSLFLLTDAPARSRFHVGVFTLSCWLVPWPHLQLAADISSVYLPFNIVFELKNIVPELTQIEQNLAPRAATPLSHFSWLSIDVLTQWFWPLSLLIGLSLFSRNLFSFFLLQRQWQQNSKPNNALWHQAGFKAQHCDIRTMHDCAPGMATGLLKPVIWLNQQQQNSNTLHTILLHELTHIRQHDPLWLSLLNLLSCLLWWNPIAHWLCRYSAQQIELSCDEQCQQLLPRGRYQQHLIELTLWANQQRKKLSTPAKKSMPMILEMSSTKAFNLQRIQHLNKETPMKLRYSIVLAALLSTTVGIGLSNAKVNQLTTDSQSSEPDPISQAFKLIAVQDYQGASTMLAGMVSNIDQYSSEQQFDIWYFSAVSLSQQQDHSHDPEVLNLFDKAFELASAANQLQRSRALQTATALALTYEQREKLFSYVQLWETLGTDIPLETRFYVAVAHYQLQQFDQAINQLESLITEAETQGQDAKDNWFGLLVASYINQNNYPKAYELQQKTEALYPNEKNQRLLRDLKLASQSI